MEEGSFLKRKHRELVARDTDVGSGVSVLWAGEQKKEAHPVLGLHDLIRLLPSCLFRI